MSDRDALERAAARSWPATETEERDGWLLRRTPEVGRLRNNSALPLRPDADLAVVDGWYATRGLRPVVQCAPLEDRTQLARALKRRNARVEVEADVLVATADGREPTLPVALLTTPGPRWQDAWARCEGRDPASVAAHAEAIFAPLAGRAVYALAPAAKGTALAVRDGAFVGLFSVAVREDARRQGVGEALVRALADWAGPDATLYAQVERGNAAGQDFWKALGFRRSHGYAHYAMASP